MYKFNKIIFLLVLILYLLAYFQGGRILYLAFYLISASFVLSILMVNRGIKNISIYQSVNKKEYYVGDEVKIETKIYNEGLIPLPCVLAQNLTINNGDVFLFFLKPLGCYTIEQIYNPTYKGRYKLGPVNIILKDYFNIFSVEKNYYENKEITIYPRVYKINKIDFVSKKDLGISKATVKGSEDLTEIVGVRKYIYGESLKKVHWKISAKKRTLYSKNFDTSISKDLIIFVDCISKKYPDKDALLHFERILEITASTVQFSLNNFTEIEIYFNTRQPLILKLKNSSEFIKILDVMLELNPDGINKITDFIKAESRNIKKRSSLLIVTSEIQKDEAIAFAELSDWGFILNVVLSKDNSVDDEVFEILKSNGVSLYGFVTRDNFGELVKYV